MGHSVSFQALPEESRLFTRLQHDPKVGTLVATLFNCGGGAYTWASLDDLDEILDGITEDVPELFPSRAEADRAMADLVADLEEARAAHPGLERRRTFLEASESDIEERLTRDLGRKGFPSPDQFVQAILFGAEMLTPPGVQGPLGAGLGVVRRAGVAEAARVLREVRPESLFRREEEDWLYCDFRAWRKMYLAAADQAEAVVVGD
jgi:hypothetical protein